jgi:hypothetical protein
MTGVIRDICLTAGDRVKYCLIADGIDNPSGEPGRILSRCDERVAAAAACLN